MAGAGMLRNLRNESFLRSQGLLAPEILVTRSEYQAADPEILPGALIQFCNWCIEEAWLVRQEVQPDAWPIYHTSYYVAQVDNGGHGQFAANSGMKLAVLDDVEVGLERLDLDDLLAIFRRFRSGLAQDAALKAAVMDGAGFGEIPDFIRELDDAFFASIDPGRFSSHASRWMKAAPAVVALAPRELRGRQAIILASNGLHVQRRSAASRRPPSQHFAEAVARLWNKARDWGTTETALDKARRQVAANRPPEWQASDALAQLIFALPAAVQDNDHAEVDRIFESFRAIHARFALETTKRWPHDIRMYASKLHYAGAQLGRLDLLEQAADAFGRSIATGTIDNLNPGFEWRSLGQALVELARLDKNHASGLTEAIDAFAKALLLDAAKSDVYGYRVASILGRAEAHLVLAANDHGAAHLHAAREALIKARPLVRKDDRRRWQVVHAELLSLQPRAEVAASDRARALGQLDRAIAWEIENDGDPRANPIRLKRLQQLRLALADT